MADNGKTYTDTIKAIQGKKFKVKYDLSTAEAWLSNFKETKDFGIVSDEPPDKHSSSLL